MIWQEVTIRTTEAAVEMISNFFHEQGAGGVTIEESGTLNKPRDTSLGQWYELPLNDIPEGEAVVQAYFPDGEPVEAIVEGLRLFVEEIRTYPTDVGQAVISVRAVKEEDWANAWKQYFKPVRLTDRLTIKPTWEDYEARSDEIILELDPGMAFGTGTHATTALCLKTLEQVIRPGMDVIDVGTGSGILSIAAAKLGARQVLALDLDPIAVSSAKENVSLNQLEDKVEVVLSDLLQVLKGRVDQPNQTGVRLPVQLVVANILAEIILLFIHDVYEALEAGGIYVVSGVIERKADLVQAGLEQAGFRIIRTETDQDWVVLVAEKS
jgi:ribosomal protein L11 methyltransferase